MSCIICSYAATIGFVLLLLIVIHFSKNDSHYDYHEYLYTRSYYTNILQVLYNYIIYIIIIRNMKIHIHTYNNNNNIICMYTIHVIS